MYNSYFGFREKPFKLVPNPDYLFLSKSHEVSLAHLTYATDQGDGFVVITGEVGTGKTTLCRIFLERLDNETESAYIFNPNLDSVELLTSICNEFGIQTKLSTVKGLLDVLNNYLITKNKEGRKVILLIDEAQNLTIENLEMVRMLSNLETTRSKLLQIVLVGQPELRDKLDSYELRQLSQRISLSCHLTPLSAKETEGYIGHRINIAAQRSLELFTAGACRKIYQYTTGIPRLINIACDRALLSAYSLNRKNVTAAIAATAIRELSNRGRAPRAGFGWKYIAWGALACLVSLTLGIWVMKSDVLTKKKTPTAASLVPRHEKTDVAPPAEQTYKIPDSPNMETPDPAPADIPEAPAQPLPQAMPERLQSDGSSLQKAVDRLDPARSRLDAVASLLPCGGSPTACGFRRSRATGI
ncbi:MAG: AAA family ATPase [Desulfosarcinaceae bacterium]